VGEHFLKNSRENSAVTINCIGCEDSDSRVK
jgi:hypothetical protein